MTTGERLYDLNGVRDLGMIGGGLGGIAIHPYENAVAFGHSSSDEHIAYIWYFEESPMPVRFATGELLSVGDAAVLDVAFNEDGTLLASSSVDGTVRIWDVATQEQVSMLPTRRWKVWQVTFAPTMNLIASVSEALHLSNIETELDLISIQPQWAFAQALEFNPQGNLLAAGGDNEILHLWAIQ